MDEDKNRGVAEHDIYQRHAEMCQVFSHPKRLEIINVLREREMTVGQLAGHLGLSPANLSQHLSMMKERRVLESRREGNAVLYRVANSKLLSAFDLLRQILLEQLRAEGKLAEGVAR
ncbi:MAG: helix-turn-helix transcriptional regulator [Chloroflexi bacterium]|nr:helix-turn-helix transcriptional regulator [Chloroflexota bacterium]